MITCTDTQIQSLPNWSFHLPNDGSNIGGKMPDRYGYCQGIPGFFPSATLFYVAGPAYATVEHYINRPILLNTGSLSMFFNLTVDENTLAVGRLIETDVILTTAGLTYNLSLQFLKGNLGWGVQVVDAAGNWIDSGITVQIASGTVHKVQIGYQFGAGVSQVVSYQFDAISTVAPLGPKIPAQKRGWADGAIIQVQQTVDQAGGSYSVAVDDLGLEWR